MHKEEDAEDEDGNLSRYLRVGVQNQRDKSNSAEKGIKSGNLAGGACGEDEGSTADFVD